MFGILTCGHKVLGFYHSVCANVLTKSCHELGKNKVNLGWRRVGIDWAAGSLDGLDGIEPYL